MKQCMTVMPRVCCGDIPLLEASEAERLAMTAKALSDPIRVQIIHFLQGRSDLCTCEFEELLGLAQSKVSYHLKILLQAGLIEREIYGSWSHYKLRDQDLLNKLEALIKKN
ncbi:ArsR/SmtB family transcription factor [Ferviditalea candida]|uniref:Metalloregulator ArsR/SmtB family transcription factor n=1 Tax=Ferviditalea candida TaxID=3108399 RepID=A0ABU5ZHR3_9BACL|nr:metalloregulator ArsR/SmtB family transcription factor [Paenibacillaceae bacterium T2]